MSRLVPYNRRSPRIFGSDFENFYNMVDNFFNDSWTLGNSLSVRSFRIDVQENENEYIVEAELPGVKKEEINIDLNEGRLNISIEREDRKDRENKNYIHRESRYASMSRSIYLPDAKHEGVKARLDNGILAINIPKGDRPNRRRIEIE